MKAVRLLAIAVIFMGLGMILNFVVDTQQPTRAEVKTMIEANSFTIFDKKYASRVERYILVQGLVLTGELEPEALYPEIQWFIDRNDQRIEALNDKLKD